MQTILGSGGAIGVELAKALTAFTADIRLVSRHPEAVNPDDQLMAADLTRPNDALKAVDGSNIVYLTVGLPYNTRVWQQTWPVLMQNVIDACKAHRSKLVFFDNIYMYDPNYLSRITEDTPVGPVSKKGVVRATIARMVLDAVEKGQLEALIARSADFYGPAIENNSMLTETVIKNLSQKKKANWLGSVRCRHSFTYTPDAGKATALLGNTPEAYNQVWHLPTAADPPTGREWIEAVAGELGVEPKYQAAPKWLVRVLGLFIPIMKEMVEMTYQYERDYVFDSTKFESRFDFTTTPYAEGIKQAVATSHASVSAAF